MLSFDEFKAAVMKLDHVTDCEVDATDDVWVRFKIEAYLVREDGLVMPGYGFVDMEQSRFAAGEYQAPGPQVLGSFERAIQDKHEGFTRYATPAEIEAHKAAKATAC